MRTYNLNKLINHLNESVVHGTYAGYQLAVPLENSITLFKHAASMPSNNGEVPAFVVQDEFGGAIERIISAKIISNLWL